MNRVITRLGFTAVAIIAGSGIIAHAQTVTTGGANGVVRDNNGNTLAGANVKLSGGQNSRDTVTAADGSWRIGLMIPGDYTVTISKAGLQTYKGSVRVSVNQTQTVNVRLALVAETVVEVIAAASAVDLTSNQIGLTVALDNIAAIPKGRDFNEIAFLSPGVVTSGRLGGVSISGASALENSFIVDGVSTNDMRKGFQGAALPTDFVDQVEVQTGGFKPEYSALGGVFNAVTKSGGNQFTGSGWFNYDANSLGVAQKSNEFTQELPVQDRYDLGFTAGGAILPDKLFYFVGANKITTTAPAGNTNFTGLTDDKKTDDQLQIYAKLQYHPSINHQLTFTSQLGDQKTDAPTLRPFLGDAQFGFNSTQKNLNLGLGWDWTISPALLLSAKLSSTSIKNSVTPIDKANPWVQDLMWVQTHVPAATPGVTFNRGGYGRYAKVNDFKSTQYKTDLQWYLGTHALKFGINASTEEFALDEVQSGPSRTMLNTDSTPNPNRNYRVVVRRNSTTGAFNGIDLVSNANKATVKRETLGFYAQDTWEMVPGIRLAYGARFDSQEVLDNAGKSALKFDNFGDQIQPRIGLTWDLNNDGKTKLSANYGRYFLAVPMQPVMRVGGTEVYLRNRYTAANSTYNATTGAWTVGATPSSMTDFGVFFSAPPVVKGTKLTQRDEYLVGIDHTLPSGWTVGIHGQHRELKNPIEDSVIDHGDGYSVFWNPTPGAVTWTQGALGSNPGQSITFNSTGYPTAFNIYQAVIFTLDKKTSKAYVSFSYTWSRLYGNYEGVGQASNGQSDALITSTFDYEPYVGYGLLPSDRTHVAKLFGTYTLDVLGNPFTAGLRAVYQSGTPMSLFDDGSTTLGLPPGTDPTLDVGGYGNANPAFGQYGNYGRTPATLQTDITLEYALTFGKFKVTPNINVFNLFNKRTATRQYTEATDANGIADPRWGNDASWMPGRNFRFGVKVAF